MSIRLRRAAAVTIAAGLLVVPLSGCTKNSYKCTSSGCDISMSGKGAKVEIGSNDVPIKLVEASEGTARIVMGEAGEVTCQAGQKKEFTDATLTCKEVGDNSVKLRLDYKG